MNDAHTPALQPSLPSSAYTDAAFYAREQAGIFRQEWTIACRAEEIANPGDWRVFDMAGDDVLVVRAKDGVLRAFHNVCRHRGARLCAAHDEAVKPGRAVLPPSVMPNGFIRCPYHAWMYREDGTLLAAPHLREGTDFNGADFALYPVGCDEWGGFVFLHQAPARAKTLVEQLGTVPARVANYQLADLRIGHHIAYSVDAWQPPPSRRYLRRP